MAAQATATGTLGGTPLSNLLVYVLDRRLEGTLVVEDSGRRKSAVLVRSGAPAKVKVPEPVALLSDVLVSGGVFDGEVAKKSYEGAEQAKKLHGQYLVERAIVDAAVIDEALTEQLLRKLEWMADLGPESVYGFYEGQDFLAGYAGGGAAVEPLTAIWRVLKRQVAAPVLDATLSRFGAREVRLHPQARVARFGFDARERGFLDIVRMKPQPLAALIAAGHLPERQTKLVLYALTITRHLDLGADARPVGLDMAPAREATPDPVAAVAEKAKARPPVAAERPASAARAEPTLSPEAEAFRKEVAELSEKIGQLDYFEILGVDRAAPVGTIQAAFFQLAKKWHPDRLDPALSDVRDAVTRIFARMSEAHQVLSSEEQRRGYERLMQEGAGDPDEQAIVQRVLRAATAFQKAEVLLRRGNLAEAEQYAAIAVENDPEQAEYVAMHADVLSQRPERAQTGNYADVVKMVNQARKQQPENLKVRLYRARVLKRSGDVDGAYREYRGIVEQDANNVEAAREVRLHEMRRGKKTTDPRKSGEPAGDDKSGGKDIGQIFGKLFKR